MRIAIILSLLLVAVGCHAVRSKHTRIDLTLRNVSTNELNWVRLEWAGPYVPGEVMPPGVEKTALDVTWPNLPSAKITFVDAKTRKPYNLDIPLTSVNDQVRTGKCHHVIFQILSYDKADAICK
jgi:hypothetical protein